MTYDRFRNLIRFAKMCGINTAGELAAYKDKRNIRSNEELYLSLYYFAIMRRNVAK